MYRRASDRAQPLSTYKIHPLNLKKIFHFPSIESTIIRKNGKFYPQQDQRGMHVKARDRIFGRRPRDTRLSSCNAARRARWEKRPSCVSSARLIFRLSSLSLGLLSFLPEDLFLEHLRLRLRNRDLGPLIYIPGWSVLYLHGYMPVWEMREWGWDWLLESEKNVLFRWKVNRGR